MILYYKLYTIRDFFFPSIILCVPLLPGAPPLLESHGGRRRREIIAVRMLLVVQVGQCGNQVSHVHVEHSKDSCLCGDGYITTTTTRHPSSPATHFRTSPRHSSPLRTSDSSPVLSFFSVHTCKTRDRLAQSFGARSLAKLPRYFPGALRPRTLTESSKCLFVFFHVFFHSLR